MSGVRLIQVPYHLGRKGEVLGAGPAPLAHAIGGDSVVVEEAGRVPERDQGDLRRRRGLGGHGARNGRRRSLSARPGRQLLERTRRGHGPGPGRWCRLVRRARGLHTPDSTPTGFLEGMILALLTGEGWNELRRELRTVPPERVVLVGARDFEPTEEERLTRSSITRADTGSLGAALDALAEHTDAVYVHIDLDVLDPSEGRASGWAVGGGLSADELDSALGAIASRFEIAAAAFTAYDPTCDEEGRIPRIAARVAPRLMRAGWPRDRRRLGLPGLAAGAAVLLTLGGTAWSRRAAGYLATLSTAVSFGAAVVCFFLGPRPQRRQQRRADDGLDVAERGRSRRRPHAAHRPALDPDDADRLRRRLADRRLLDRLHGRRRRGAPLLRLHGALRLLDAAPRHGRQLPDAARRLGPRRPLLVPADRLPPRAAERCRGREEGVHHERRWRRDDGARLLPADPEDGLARLRPGVEWASGAEGSWAVNLVALGLLGGRSPSRLRSRSTPGCPTRWKARPRSAPSSTRRRWSPPGSICSCGSGRSSSTRRMFRTWPRGSARSRSWPPGLIALVQVDIKRVIAYSTMSQIGYMFLAAGSAPTRTRCST